MRRIIYYISAVLLTAGLIGPMNLQAQNFQYDRHFVGQDRDRDGDRDRDRHERRYYDREHGDYHAWNEHERRAYRDWLKNRREAYRDYEKLRRSQQREYWQWRHEHPDYDRR